MCATPLKTVEQFFSLEQNVAAYHVVDAAMRLGIIAALVDGQLTRDNLAAVLALDPEATGLILNALTHTGLVEAYGDDFALSQVGKLLANPRSLDDRHWGQLELFVRLGAERFERASVGENSAETRHDSPVRNPRLCSQARHWVDTPVAMDAAAVLDFGRSRRGLRVLEVGGGAAVFSAAFAHRDHDSRFTVLDVAEALSPARQTVSSVELDSQFDFFESDPRQPSIASEQFDLIFAAGMLPYFSEEMGKTWIAKLTRSLKPRGELVIIDRFAGQPNGARALAFFELEICLLEPGSRLHRPQLVREWMYSTGLTEVRYAHLPSPPHVWGLIVAEKSPTSQR